jgi:hypothetical protein
MVPVGLPSILRWVIGFINVTLRLDFYQIIQEPPPITLKGGKNMATKNIKVEETVDLESRVTIL